MDRYWCIGKTDHILPKFYDSRGIRHFIFSIWYTATKAKITSSVIIHKYSRIK